MCNKDILETKKKDLKFSITNVVTMVNDGAIGDSQPVRATQNYQYNLSILDPEKRSQRNHIFFLWWKQGAMKKAFQS